MVIGGSICVSGELQHTSLVRHSPHHHHQLNCGSRGSSRATSRNVSRAASRIQSRRPSMADVRHPYYCKQINFSESNYSILLILAVFLIIEPGIFSDCFQFST